MGTVSSQHHMLGCRRSFVLMAFTNLNKGLACTVGTLWIPSGLTKIFALRFKHLVGEVEDVICLYRMIFLRLRIGIKLCQVHHFQNFQIETNWKSFKNIVSLEVLFLISTADSASRHVSGLKLFLQVCPCCYQFTFGLNTNCLSGN